MFRVSFFPSVLLLLASLLLRLQAKGQNLDTAHALRYDNPDSSIAICNEVIRKWDGNWDDLSRAHHIIGLANWIKGEYPVALKAYEEAARIRQERGDSLGYATTLNGMGLVFWKMRIYDRAMNAYLHSLSISEMENDSVMMGKTLGNIGILLEEQDNLTQALEFHKRSLEIAEKLSDENTIANGYNNIGIIYRRLKNYDKAIYYLTKSLESDFTKNNDYGRALSLSNIGLVYNNQKLYGLADKYFNESLEIYESLGDVTGMAMNFGNLASNAQSLSNTKEALELGLKGLKYAEESGNVNYIMNACRVLAKAYGLTGKPDLSVKYLERFMEMSDSLVHNDTRNQVALIQQQYDYEREQIKTELDRERERADAQAELGRQVVIRNSIFGLGLMALIMLGLQYRNFIRKKRDNVLLAAKNDEISKQKQEITDSIVYAKRLQDARLPHTEMLDKLFSECYLFYRPKDIVSGDFYWAERVNKRTFLAVADCTGHGVPGAMVSMVATEGLNEAVLKRKLTSPAEILTFLNEHIHDAFHTNSSDVKDGLDIALVVIEADGSTVCFSGANNSLLVATERLEMPEATLKESTDNLHLHQIKSDRRSIGGLLNEAAFNEYSFTLEPNDRLVMTTDGYADQFGGEKGKKLGSARLRKLLPESLQNNAPQMLESFFDQWKAGEEQVDDVTVMVVRP